VRVLLVCTDRHTHPERRLGWLLPETGAGGRVLVFVPWVVKAELVRGERAEQRGTLRIPPCPTCRRTVPLRQQTAARRYDALTAAAVTTWDVSLR
jgi:hypothetical protein